VSKEFQSPIVVGIKDVAMEPVPDPKHVEHSRRDAPLKPPTPAV